MGDYERARASFSWSAARAELDGLPGGGLNIAHEAVDRHASGPHADTVALRFLTKGGGVLELTYAELRATPSQPRWRDRHERRRVAPRRELDRGIPSEQDSRPLIHGRRRAHMTIEEPNV
jgi:hypothetical protein